MFILFLKPFNNDSDVIFNIWEDILFMGGYMG